MTDLFHKWHQETNEPLPLGKSLEDIQITECQLADKVTLRTELSINTRFKILQPSDTKSIYAVVWRNAEGQFRQPAGWYVLGYVPHSQCETDMTSQRFFCWKNIGWSFELDVELPKVEVPRPKPVDQAPPPQECHVSFYVMDDIPEQKVDFEEDQLFDILKNRLELYYLRQMAHLDSSTSRLKELRERYPDPFTDLVGHWYMFLFSIHRKIRRLADFVEVEESALFSFRIRRLHAFLEVAAWAKQNCPFIHFTLVYLHGRLTEENRVLQALLETNPQAQFVRIPFQYATRLLNEESIVSNGYVYAQNTAIHDVLSQHFDEAYGHKRALYGKYIDHIPVNEAVLRVFARLDVLVQDKLKAQVTQTDVPDIEELNISGPPCIQNLHRKLFETKQHLDDAERFVHSSVLIKLGYTDKSVLDLWEPAFSKSDPRHAYNWRGHVSTLRSRAARMTGGINCKTVISHYAKACPFTSGGIALKQMLTQDGKMSMEEADRILWIGQWCRRHDLSSSLDDFCELLGIHHMKNELEDIFASRSEEFVRDYLAKVNAAKKWTIRHEIRGDSVAQSISQKDIVRCMQAAGFPELSILAMLGECDSQDVSVACLQCRTVLEKKYGVSKGHYSPAQAFYQVRAIKKNSQNQAPTMVPADLNDDEA